MNLFLDTLRWLTDSAQYSGPDSIPFRLSEHVMMSVQSLALAALIALPIGIYVGHKRRFEFISVTIGNLGRAVPSFGILAFAYLLTQGWPGNLGYWPTFIALVLLAIPPILTNSYVGVKGIDPDTVEAARGMGMTEREVLLRLEVPIASPIILVAIRTAAVQVVATATLGAVAGWGGLGRYIVDGFAAGNDPKILGGAILVGLLAILTELIFSVLQRILAPKLSSTGQKRVIGKADAPLPRPADSYLG
jgi:osmoprotectant transport system permease protein